MGGAKVARCIRGRAPSCRRFGLRSSGPDHEKSRPRDAGAGGPRGRHWDRRGDATGDGERIVAADASQFNSVGVQLGYYYDNSPINANDGTPPPAFSLDKYVPTTRPGSRAPHSWLRDGTSLYDALGPDFTLLRLGNASGDVRPLENAARIRNVPLKVLAIPEREVLAVYENFPFVLIRPDQHIAWRGSELPDDPVALLDRVRGA